MRKSLSERFWEKVNKAGPTMPNMTTPCWVWTAKLDDDGYGTFRLDGHMKKSHRVVWEIYRGFIPVGVCVLHRCDNPACVNYEGHLFLGTQAINVADCKAKGRLACGERNGTHLHPESIARGERNGSAKLTEEKVRCIFGLRREGWTETKLAARFGVGETIIHNILARKKWTHLRLDIAPGEKPRELHPECAKKIGLTSAAA